MKWDVPLDEVWDTYKTLSEEAIEEGAEIIIWPETAIPVTYTFEKNLHKEIQEWAKVPIIFGTNTCDTQSDPLSYHNSAVCIYPGRSATEPLSIYNKRHLVPWGEYIPLENLLPFVKKIVEGGGGEVDFPEEQKPKFLIWMKLRREF